MLPLPTHWRTVPCLILVSNSSINMVQVKWFDGDQVPADAEDGIHAANELSEDEDEVAEVTDDEEDSEGSEEEDSDAEQD